ncbi:MAG: branched-chain amino acid transport system II carrier protein [Sphingobacteriia bacterium]|nr:branched-chain amino acid transport system II carrier protein [Sphingobacteriia bacterium]
MKKRDILIYGFSMFSMFFGSGNLVFPLKIGIDTGQNWLLGFLGLFITGITLPFLGLFVIKLHNGSYNSFFAEGGKFTKIFLPLFTLSLLGSFGVVPRCITVAHGGIEYLWPQIELSSFSLLYCILCYLICLKDKLMISILGKWLTPILLSFLIFLIIYGIIKAPQITAIVTNKPESFLTGFFQGYETMDLLAAFFFSSVMFKQIQSTHNPESGIIKLALKSSLIGASLLSFVYLGFVYLGAHYKTIVADVTPELILPSISFHLLGEKAVVIISIIILLSCLTTAVALNNIYARYLTKLFKLNDNKFPIVLCLTTGASFFASLFDFKGISSFLSPVLEVTYPGLIALTILSIATQKYKALKIVAFYGTIGLIVLKNYF